MCTKPLKAYQNPEGGRPIFGYQGVREGLPEMQLPCGKCSECVKDYYTAWATRGFRELVQWESSVFITLTYDNENLPGDYSLKKKDVQDFIKRVKKHFKSNKENPVRQIYCGEYGKKTLRPHYHVILFNVDFTDKQKHYVSDGGKQVFTSETLSRLWGKGNCDFGYAEPESIAYLFKYVLKKKTRKEKEKPLYHEHDGCIYECEHEFIEASRNPGIGACARDSSSIRKGFLVTNGVKSKLPKYYLEYLKKTDLPKFLEIQDKRATFALERPKESAKRREQKEEALKLLTDTKRRM